MGLQASGRRNHAQRATLLRVAGLALSIGCVAAAHYAARIQGNETRAWRLLMVALVVAVIAEARMMLPGTARPAEPAHTAWGWKVLGLLVALGGAALWANATVELLNDWTGNFDRSWLSWLGAALIMALGLDLSWRRDASPVNQPERLSLKVVLALLALVAVAAFYRLGNIADFPGDAYVTQVEELQTGMWGVGYIHGGRVRWEYLSFAWLSAIGIWLGGPTLLAMRVPFAIVSVLKLVPMFIWFRYVVGSVGALVAIALAAVSAWDVIQARIPGHHNGLVIAIAFALLAGPAARGRPSAYIWLGFIGGYVVHEYVAYRPLAFMVVAGAVVLSLRDRSSGWLVRLSRPLLTIALIASMAIPVFFGRLGTADRIWNEYFNGWNRARAQGPYYDDRDAWNDVADKRIERSRDALSLFYFRSDPNTVRNTGEPLLDPITGALLLLGVGYAATRVFSPIIGLTLVGFVVTIAGTMVLTGNFDAVRVGAVAPYVFALVACGAAALVAILRRLPGRSGRLAPIAVLVAATLVAAYLNTTTLLHFWSAPTPRRFMRNNLARLSILLAENTRPNEQAVGVAPWYGHVLEPNDAMWLLGRQIDGIAAEDIGSALQFWVNHPRDTLWFIFAAHDTPALEQYLEWLIPGLKMEFVADPLEHGSGEFAYGHVAVPSPQEAAQMKQSRCRGARGEYELVGAPDTVIFRASGILPFVDPTTWPSDLRVAVYNATRPLTQIRVRLRATFTVRNAGDYAFDLDTFAGQAHLVLDNQTTIASGAKLPLAAGPHVLEVTGTFQPLVREPNLRLSWSGPDTFNQRQVMPLYRLTDEDAECLGHPSNNGAGGAVAQPAMTAPANGAGAQQG